MKKIFTIVVTYNGEQWIRQCLESLGNSSVKTDIVVIDNMSNDATTDIIRSYFPEVELFVMPQNLGFGKANNYAMKIALEKGADYFFLLNQDAWVETNTIGELLEVSRNNRFLGIVSPIHLNGSGRSFDRNFYSYLLKSDFEDYLRSLMLSNKSTRQWINTRFVNAAAWLVTKECILTTGGFDPFFFHYGEDRNFCHRVIYKGLKIGIVPSAKIYHDREDRNRSKKNLKQSIDHDFMNFKIDASNIRRSAISFFIIKRICRHALFCFYCFITLNFKRVEYHFKMGTLIVSSVASIYACRKRAKSNLLFA